MLSDNDDNNLSEINLFCKDIILEICNHIPNYYIELMIERENKVKPLFLYALGNKINYLPQDIIDHIYLFYHKKELHINDDVMKFKLPENVTNIIFEKSFNKILNKELFPYFSFYFL